MRRSVEVLTVACLAGALAACSSSPTPYEPSPSDEERIAIESAVGGPEYGTVLQKSRAGGSHPLNSYSSCDGYDITLTEKATPEMLADVLMELVTQRSCFGYGSTVKFADRDTVVLTWLSGMREAPDNFDNVADLVYGDWPSEVLIQEDETGSVELLSRVKFVPAQMSSLMTAFEAIPAYDIPEASESQLPVRVALLADIGDDAELLAPRSHLVFDPEFRSVTEELISEITAIDVAAERPDSPIGVQLEIRDGAVQGKVMLAVTPEVHVTDTTVLWGEFDDQLVGPPKIRDDTPQWSPAWAVPTDRAFDVAADVHELVAGTGLRDEVEVLLVEPGRFGYVRAGYFDTAAARGEAGLASSHPDRVQE